MFASGTGTNFRSIVNAIKQGKLKSKISLLITNNSNCGAAGIAKTNNIKCIHISRKKFPDLPDNEYQKLFLNALESYKIDFIVLAGYMKKIGNDVIAKYRNRIINIHPALLPDFGGEGMYGINVHRAVIASGASVSGISIHYVDENYDNGKIIFQKSVAIENSDDEFSLQKKILKLEHEYYPKVIGDIENNCV